MTVPFASGLLTLTVSVKEPEPPAASDPIDQVTTPPDSAPPPVADTNVVWTGTVSESTTAVAPEFPVFELAFVEAVVPPVATGSGPAAPATFRTGAEVTVVVMAFPATGEVSVESTLNVPFV